MATGRTRTTRPSTPTDALDNARPSEEQLPSDTSSSTQIKGVARYDEKVPRGDARTVPIYQLAELLPAELAFGLGSAREKRELHGASDNLAATIIAQADDVRRFRNASAFARFCGAAPIPCGSGKTATRHRLHRGGNRQLNAALYRIAIVQQRHHPHARAYLARKITEGKTPREARRALKRHLANVLYRRLHAWANTAP